MGLFAKLLLGDGKLNPEVRRELESEGVVMIEENLPGSVRYHRFKAPGRYHDGKVVPQRLAVGVSERRLVVYCRSGRAELMDSEFTQPNLSALEVSLDGPERFVLRVDYDKMGQPRVSGQVSIHAKTANAAAIVEQLQKRLLRGESEIRSAP